MAHLRFTDSFTTHTDISLRNPNPNPKLIPLCTCPCRPLSSQSQILHHRSISSSNLSNITFFFAKRKPVVRFTLRTGVSAQPRFLVAALSQAEPEQLPQHNAQKEDILLKSQQQVGQFRNRVVFGLGIGITVGGVVLAGGWVFTVAMAAVVFAGAREYFELVRSHGITEGMTPPPRYVSRVCSIICALMPLFIM